jgi:hypothetical protein
MSGIIDWEAFGAEDEFPETEEGAEGLLDELQERPPWGEIAEDIAMDCVLAAADTLSLDLSEFVVIIPVMVTNMVQIYKSTGRAESLLEAAEDRGMNEEMVLEMKGVTDDLNRDLIDMVQGLVRVIPATGEEWAAVGAGGFATYFARSEVKDLALLYNGIVDELPDVVRELLQWKGDEHPASPHQVFLSGLAALGDLGEAIDRYREGLALVRIYGDQLDAVLDDRTSADVDDDVEDAEELDSDDDLDLTIDAGSDEDEGPVGDVLDEEDDLDLTIDAGSDEDDDMDFALIEGGDEDEREPDFDDVEALDLRSEGYSLMLAARCMAANGVQSPMVVQHLTELYAVTGALADVAMDDSIDEDALERDMDALILSVQMTVASLGSIEGELPRQVALGIGGLCAMLVPLMWKIKDEGTSSLNLDEEVFLEVKEDVGNAIVLAEGSMDPYSEELNLDPGDMVPGSCGELDSGTEPALAPGLSPEPVTPPVIDRQPETMQPMPDPMQPPAVAPGPDLPPRLEPVEEQGTGGGGGALAALLLGSAAVAGGYAWHRSRARGKKKR